MPKTRFSVHMGITGADETCSALEDMALALIKSKPIMVKAMPIIQRQMIERMAEAPWLPLTEGTVERKIGQFENPEVFRDESRPIRGKATRIPDLLYHAIVTPGTPGALRRVTPKSATFGVESKNGQLLWYARFVQNVKGRQRRILAFTPANAIELAELVKYEVYSSWTERW